MINFINDLLNKVRFTWASLILKIKNFFSGSNEDKSSKLNDEAVISKTEITDNHAEDKKQSRDNNIDSEEDWHDALEEREEFFDAVEDLSEQKANKRKEYEENKYYSLQQDLHEKIEFDRSTQTLALAFEINKPKQGDSNQDLSKFKLRELKKNDNLYTFTLEDDKKDCIELHSTYLNMYCPEYFSKHNDKSIYTELFSPKENGISNDIIISLQIPRGMDILTKKFDWYNPMMKDAASSLGTKTETNWPIKDVLVRGDFINTINKHICKQPEVEEKKSCEPFEVTDVKTLQGIGI
ncbi:hypothetical protein [Wolbachia endosymbiont of Ctenocephalides felis wCfeT]|uniref:hypothetical protein n=1 Tax=Wolbachia endosymbiont of Ctenocephalides felis wCfeT TaxID=2732593 RepID=UPI001445040B|nr:hypothetical protein [Wolbachia endosymbiont of Ctenocephalides felis wCfeT]